MSLHSTLTSGSWRLGSVVRRGLAFALLACLPLGAFPPGPSYVIYGVVRDQVGTTLRVVGAEILLLRNNVEIGRAPVVSDLFPDSNYELAIKIDQGRSDSRTYSDKAVAPQGLYSLAVEMNGQRYYPIEVAGNLRAGYGGERVRIDLNLGADTDGDGLPDAWEEWQLYQAGKKPGANGWDLSLITRDGDFDGDGASNYLEYVAGTFAGDATERFELKIMNKTATEVAFEFFTITGKVYAIEQSSDLKTWTVAPLSIVSGAPKSNYFKAPDVNIKSAFVETVPGAARFYRLTVR